MASELSDLQEEGTWGDANGGIDRTPCRAQAGGDPVVAIVKGGIAAARAIPIFLEADGTARSVERVGLCNVLAKPIETALGEIDRDDRQLWVIEAIEAGGEHHGAGGTAQRVEGGAWGQGFAIALIFAPADFEIFEAAIVVACRPNPGRNIRALHGDAGMKQAVVDDVDGTRGFAGSWRIKRCSRPSASNREEGKARGEDELRDRNYDALR